MLQMCWQKETEKLFHWNFSIPNIGKDWEGEEEKLRRGKRRKGREISEERDRMKGCVEFKAMLNYITVLRRV